MVTSRGNLFPEKIVNEIISKVTGKSSLVTLSKQIAIPFNGQTEFVFTMDSEIDVVAENGKKSHGGITVEPVKMVPIKVEYGARVSDEFLYATEEEQVPILEAFTDGYSRKLARGIDIMGFHGINPRSGAASAVIGANNFDSKVNQIVGYNAADPDANVEAAVAMVQGAEGMVTGMAMAPAFSSALASYKVNGVKQFPELGWGANPGTINGLQTDVNNTVSAGTDDLVIVGDFADMFKWGYSKEIPFEIIKYGDPDNSGNDLKGYNQVYLRAETYVGWGIMSPEHFAMVKKPATTPEG